jgi:hypothetical protein
MIAFGPFSLDDEARQLLWQRDLKRPLRASRLPSGASWCAVAAGW